MIFHRLADFRSFVPVQTYRARAVWEKSNSVIDAVVNLVNGARLEPAQRLYGAHVTVSANVSGSENSMVSRVIPVDPFDLVIFGGTGDLARKKILPGLFRRFSDGQMPPEARIIGAARSDFSADEYRKMVETAITEEGPRSGIDKKRLAAFLGLIDYVTVDATGTGGWSALKKKIRKSTIDAFYFSVAPSLFGALAERLRTNGISSPGCRIVVEKPFGRDLATARDLNASLAEHFREEQIYRIDHYLGKETVQNLMAVRFANVLFEPLWNSQYVDHVQITVAESVGVGGRGSYYDKSGAMRDMVQNHLLSSPVVLLPPLASCR